MTLQQRAQERRNKIIRTAWSGLAARIVTIAASLLMVPMSVHYLGKEQYGLWVAVSSLVAMLGFMDGGAGNAVINMVAHASGAKRDDLAKIVSTAFFSLMAVALSGCLLFLLTFHYAPWDKLLGVAGSRSPSDLNVVVLIVGLFFFASMSATLVGKVQRGLQEGNLDNFWNAVGSALSLLFVYIVIKKDVGLVGFVIAFLAGPMLAYLASNVHYLFLRRRDLRPQFCNVDAEIAKNLFTVGGIFFVLQIAATIQGQADNVIIANMLGSAAVTSYAICMKISLTVPMLFNLLLTPLWPAYREAMACGDMQWAKRIFLNSMRWAVWISIPSAFAFVMLGGKIIEFWVGQNVVPSTGLLIGCGLWMMALMLGSAVSIFANALQLITPQIIAAALSGSINILLTIWLIPRVGAEGAVYGTLISYVLCVPPIYFYVLRKAMR